MGKFADHYAKWKTCTACSLHEKRKQVVLARGTIPCDVLFVGEAPGASEDVLGKPFCGPAGQLLIEIVSAAFEEDVKCAYTNLIACIPRFGGKKISEPPGKCIEACADRLREFVSIAKPSVIVAVGKLPENWLGQLLELDGIHCVSIMHPAAILRMEPVQKPIACKRCVVTLSDVLEVL